MAALRNPSKTDKGNTTRLPSAAAMVSCVCPDSSTCVCSNNPPVSLCVSKCYVFKSRLQEYAQKVGFITPVYETVKEGPSHEPTFRSTVIVNEVRYESLRGFYNRKAAEQSAAEVALFALANNGETNQCISQPVHETGLCKNLLQEYAQKMNYAIPSYEIVKVVSGRVPLFSCTATIGEMKYIGGNARTKKEAEIKAARTALLAIQSSGDSMSNTPEESMFTVVPCKKQANDLESQTLKTSSALDPKKKRYKKKSRKRRRRQNGGERDNVLRESGTAQDHIPTSENIGSENAQAVCFPPSEMGAANIVITEALTSPVAVEMHSVLGNGQMATMVNCPTSLN